VTLSPLLIGLPKTVSNYSNLFSISVNFSPISLFLNSLSPLPKNFQNSPEVSTFTNDSICLVISVI